MKRIIKGSCVVLLVAGFVLYTSCITITQSPAAERTPNSPVAPYVILTDITNPQDPYFPAISDLKGFRGGRIVNFSGTVKNAAGDLIAIKPKYVAVVIKPAGIDEFFAHDIFNLSREVEKAAGSAFRYGFVTGSSGPDVTAYIKNVVAWEHDSMIKNSLFRAYYSTREGAFANIPGGWGEKQMQSEIGVFSALGISSSIINVNQVGRSAVVADLKPAQLLYLHFLLHGSPTSLEQVPFDNIISLGYPSVVFNSGCYGGCISRWYNQETPGILDDYKQKATEVDVHRSLPSRFLRSGCVAYFGHMRMTGSNLWVNEMSAHLAASPAATAGELAGAWYKKAGQQKTEKPIPYPKPIPGVDWTLFDYSSIILYGDPAVRMVP